MTEKYSTKNYKPGYSPSRLQHNYKMTYENAYNLAQDLNNVFNRLYIEYRKETERLQKELDEEIEHGQTNVYEVAAQAARGANCALKEVKKLEQENARLREELEEIQDAMTLLNTSDVLEHISDRINQALEGKKE